MVSDKLWEEVLLLLPLRQVSKPGRPRMDDRKAFCAIYHVLRTGIQWKALPRSLGAASTVHDRFQEWAKAGVFEKLWHSSLLEYKKRKGLCWTWQALDGILTKTPLGGEATSKNPNDRAKWGIKRSLLVEGNGVPGGLAVDGANIPDIALAEDTFESILVERPKPNFENMLNLGR